MSKKSIFRTLLLATTFVALGTAAANAQGSDTSKVCTGQTTLPKGPDAPNGVTYSYAWFDAQNGNASAGTTQQITIAGSVLANTTGAPKQFIYKLVVSQSGANVAVCPSDTFYKVILVYPALNNTLTSNYSVICPGNGTNLVLTSPTTSGAAQTPTLLGAYGTVKYAWSGSGIPASTTTTGIANNTYTVTSANLPAASVTPYTYTAAVSYVETLAGTTAVLAACTHSATTNVTISNAPSINNSSVSTTYQ
ncbi:MAG: hypothetical protein EOP49_22555 [Sphingobacteriales bacterium]|nr:MAG: hypothetical protein EOP49_22555 [Sphingobacteriales bacterium]